MCFFWINEQKRKTSLLSILWAVNGRWIFSWELRNVSDFWCQNSKHQTSMVFWNTYFLFWRGMIWKVWVWKKKLARRIGQIEAIWLSFYSGWKIWKFKCLLSDFRRKWRDICARGTFFPGQFCLFNKPYSNLQILIPSESRWCPELNFQKIIILWICDLFWKLPIWLTWDN